MVAGTGVEPVIFELMRLAWLSVPLARNNLVGKAGFQPAISGTRNRRLQH
jgi:hypothetical protein